MHGLFSKSTGCKKQDRKRAIMKITIIITKRKKIDKLTRERRIVNFNAKKKNGALTEKKLHLKLYILKACRDYHKQKKIIKNQTSERTLKAQKISFVHNIMNEIIRN
jgi:hypothetical protein